MCDLGVSFSFYFRKKKSVRFLRNGVLILNWKVNKEAGAICFEIRIPRKKNKEILRKVPSKIYGRNFIMEKNKNIFWFFNNSEYHHREMGLYWSCPTPFSYRWKRNIHIWVHCWSLLWLIEKRWCDQWKSNKNNNIFCQNLLSVQEKFVEQCFAF